MLTCVGIANDRNKEYVRKIICSFFLNNSLITHIH